MAEKHYQRIAVNFRGKRTIVQVPVYLHALVAKRIGLKPGSKTADKALAVYIRGLVQKMEEAKQDEVPTLAQAVIKQLVHDIADPVLLEPMDTPSRFAAILPKKP